nr:MAG TPA: hypothetical protein [Caudoviricetes sp.]
MPCPHRPCNAPTSPSASLYYYISKLPCQAR